MEKLRGEIYLLLIVSVASLEGGEGKERSSEERREEENNASSVKLFLEYYLSNHRVRKLVEET